MRRFRLLSQEATSTRRATLANPRRMRTGQMVAALSDTITPTPFWHHSGTTARNSESNESAEITLTYRNISLPTGGLEPPHPRGLRILSPLRLPFRQAGLLSAY